MLRCLTSRRCRLLSSRRSTASCPLTLPLPFASWPPVLFTSCLSAGCRVAPVVPPPPPPPHDFASASSSSSGCHHSQGPTCRAAATSRPLATSALQRAASASQRAAASQLAVSSSSLPMRRHLHRRCDYDCCPWRSLPSSLVVKLVSLSSLASTSVAIVFVVLSRRSIAIAIVVNFVTRRAVAIVVRTLTTNPPTGVPTAHIVQFRYGTLTTTIPELEEPGNGNETTVIDSSSGKGPSE